MNKRHDRIYRKTRNRGQVASFTVHLLLLLVAFLPFLSFQAPAPPSKEALVFQFDYPYNNYIAPQKFVEEKPLTTGEPSKMSGSEEGGNEIKAEPMEARPQQAPPTTLTAPAKPTAVQQVSAPINSNTSENIPMPLPKIYTQSTWQTVEDVTASESDRVEEMRIIDQSSTSFGEISEPGSPDGDGDAEVSSEGFGTKPGGGGGSGNGTGSTSGNGSGPGGGTGTGNAGNKTGVGNNGTGMDWGVGLDGLLNRKLVRRADVGRLAVKEGKISMYICVDQQGNVVTTKYDLVGSTLKDPAFIAKAEACAKSYLWAPDPSAPPKQCGKLTFVFKIK